MTDTTRLGPFHSYPDANMAAANDENSMSSVEKENSPLPLVHQREEGFVRGAVRVPFQQLWTKEELRKQQSGAFVDAYGVRLNPLDFAKSACSAAKSGDCERLKRILTRYPGTIHHDGVDGTSGYTPLHYAARAGRLEAVLLLIKSGADVNKRTIAGGATSLHRAAYMGHTSIVEALINHGADGCVQDSDGETPAHKAFSQNHIELGTLLLKRFPRSGTLFDRFGRVAEELSSEQGG